MERSILPNATPFPNYLTDEVMPLVSSDEWKIIHFGVVTCLRLDRSDDGVSIAQFVQGTSLQEDRVRECLTFLCDSAQVFLRHDRPRRPHVYKLNLEMSAAQLEILERRKKGLAGDAGSEPDRVSREAPPSAVEPPPKPAPRTRAKAAEPFPEHPSVDIRLDGTSLPVAERLRQTLPATERAAFERLLSLYPRGTWEGEEGEVWGLFRLWQTYGFASVNNALQQTQASANLSELNRACLRAEIRKLYEQEIGTVTPGLSGELDRLAADFPILTDWQDAFRTAVRINKRRLSTVETILKNQRQKELDSAQRPAARSKRMPKPHASSAEASSEAGELDVEPLPSP